MKYQLRYKTHLWNGRITQFNKITIPVEFVTLFPSIVIWTRVIDANGDQREKSIFHKMQYKLYLKGKGIAKGNTPVSAERERENLLVTDEHVRSQKTSRLMKSIP